MKRNFPNHVLGAGLFAVVAAFSLAACGDDSAAEATDTVDPDEGTAPSIVEVSAIDFSYEGLPGKVSAGTKLTLSNDAPAELHELVAFRLPDDEERSLEEILALPPDQMSGAFGGPPRTVLLAAPDGEPIAAVGDGTLSEPGRYAVICFIPTGVPAEEYLAAAAQAGDGPPQLEGYGPPHLAHGMWAELIVE
jgi:hypothetical protein